MADTVPVYTSVKKVDQGSVKIRVKRLTLVVFIPDIVIISPKNDPFCIYDTARDEGSVFDRLDYVNTRLTLQRTSDKKEIMTTAQRSILIESFLVVGLRKINVFRASLLFSYCLLFSFFSLLLA